MNFELLKVDAEDEAYLLDLCREFELRYDRWRKDLKIDFWAVDQIQNLFAFVAPTSFGRYSSLHYYFYCCEHLFLIHNVNMGNRVSFHDFPTSMESKREEIKEIFSTVLYNYGIFISDKDHGKRNDDGKLKYPELAAKAEPFPLFVKDGLSKNNKVKR